MDMGKNEYTIFPKIWSSESSRGKNQEITLLSKVSGAKSPYFKEAKSLFFYPTETTAIGTSLNTYSYAKE